MLFSFSSFSCKCGSGVIGCGACGSIGAGVLSNMLISPAISCVGSSAAGALVCAFSPTMCFRSSIALSMCSFESDKVSMLIFISFQCSLGLGDLYMFGGPAEQIFT